MTNLIDQVTHQIRSQGGRMTAQRQLILDALESLAGHPTAEEIYSYVQQKDPSINISTVYRTLRLLEEQGVVNSRLFGDDRGQQRFDQALAADHYHFRCMVCSAIIEFSEPLVEAIKETYASQTGAKVETASLVLTGVCSNCHTNSP